MISGTRAARGTLKRLGASGPAAPCRASGYLLGAIAEQNKRLPIRPYETERAFASRWQTAKIAFPMSEISASMQRA